MKKTTLLLAQISTRRASPRQSPRHRALLQDASEQSRCEESDVDDGTAIARFNLPPIDTRRNNALFLPLIIDCCNVCECPFRGSGIRTLRCYLCRRLMIPQIELRLFRQCLTSTFNTSEGRGSGWSPWRAACGFSSISGYRFKRMNWFGVMLR